MMEKIKPYPYQKEGVRDMEHFLANGGGVLNADDMGLGKTLQTLWLLKRARLGQMYPALIVCPANVKYGWEYAAQTHINVQAHVLEGRKPPRGGMGTPAPVTIINPDILEKWVPTLGKAGFKTLVLDECQFFGNPNSKRTRAAMALARITPWRIALSGTPLMNAPGELWPTLFMMRPDYFNSLFSFAEDYCEPRLQFGRWTFKGAQNLPELHAKLRRVCMVRRLKSEVLGDLPAKNRVMVPMELSDEDQYNLAVTDFRAWLRQNYRDDLGRVNRAMRAFAVTRVGYLLRLAARLKARAVVDWANRFIAETGEKLVLFGVHRKMIGMLQRRVNAKCVVIDGGVAGRNRKLAVDQFRRDKDTRVCIGNMKAMGVGVDGLQDVCSNAAFTELYWVPGLHAQAEDRLCRIGQKWVSWMHYLVAPNTIEGRMCSVIQNKQTTIHSALDGHPDAGDMNVHDLLIQALEDGSCKA